MQTRDEIIARMTEIATRGLQMTDDEMNEYERLENSLNIQVRGQGIQERHNNAVAALNAGMNPDNRTEEDLRQAEYRQAFNAYMRTGIANQDLIVPQTRALGVTGADSAGGFLAPDDFRQKLVERMRAFGGVANVVETITTGDGRRLPWVVMEDDTLNEGEIMPEHVGPATGQDLGFGEAELNAYSYSSAGAPVGGVPTPLRLSRELLQDSVFDVEGLVSRRLGERIARKQAKHIVNGDGTGEPLGIAVGGQVEFGNGDGTVAYSELLDVVHAIDPAYRQSGNVRWAFNDTSLKMFRGILDGNGRPLLKEASDGIAGDPGGSSLLGYPVTIDQAFANYSAAAATNWGVFGDLTEGYVIRRVKEIELLVNPYSRMNERQVEYTAWARMDATQQNAWSYIRLSGNAA